MGFDFFMAPVRVDEPQVYVATIVTGGDSARYYYMKKQPYKKDKRDLLLQVKNLLTVLKGE